MEAVSTDHSALAAWLQQLRYTVIRALETPQPARHPDGRGLRGILLTHDIVLTRERRLYVVRDGRASQLDEAATLSRVSLRALQRGYAHRVKVYRERSRSLDRA